MFGKKFLKNSEISISLESGQWEPSSSMRTDGQRETDRHTDMTKLIVAFRNVAKLPEKKIFFLQLNDNRFY